MKKRIAAEWEPVKGVLVAWPPLLPKRLFKAFNEDTTMYVMVMDDAARQGACEAFERWGLDMNKIEFVSTPSRDGRSKYGPYWVRDWGPFAVFQENKAMKLVSGRFCSTPATRYGQPTVLLEVNGAIDNNEIRTPLDKPTGPETYMPNSIAEYFGQPNEVFDFAFIGGNVLTDGLDMLISSDILLQENIQMNQTNPECYFSKVASATGMNTYAIADQYENFGIQHVDCIMKICSEDTILVARPPKDHPYYERVEHIIDTTLRNMRNYYGRPYRILRYDTARYHGDELAAYSNSLILGTNVYVPMFGIPEDADALKVWAEAMPGYTIKGFEYIVANEPESSEGMFYPEIGWDAADALHCRTRGVWDPEMLFISINRPDDVVAAEDQRIEAIIVDYSEKGIIKGSEKLYWRVRGTESWNESELAPLKIHERYAGVIPAQAPGAVVDYYISAESASGAMESRPATAPVGFYTFTVE